MQRVNKKCISLEAKQVLLIHLRNEPWIYHDFIISSKFMRALSVGDILSNRIGVCSGSRSWTWRCTRIAFALGRWPKEGHIPLWKGVFPLKSTGNHRGKIQPCMLYISALNFSSASKC